ncbi:autoinducer 2 ABC transporter substrate-binding protein [Clostridium grantii]|uniref:Rhamnose transport system substrate-binding protein n=1 Tax=Clostridium grantii DSM 8605 TaxID=1121316 RepID=A0A1M5SW17_9CLOT|nr:autoinducer 2 ABC transporter substrate-binding protein [Clostridium grantii]SHH42686.1 rhamnose transport system substrate-binding protein [Clostridium grantii DSM 8605]
MKKHLCIFSSILLCLSLLSGCNSENLHSDTDQKKLNIALVPKIVGIPYFEAAADGAFQAADELGVNVIYTGPTTTDAAQQVNLVQDLISRKVDAIAVSANDPVSLAPILKKAKEAGITVLTWDSDSQDDSRELFVNQADAEYLGRHIMDNLAENMDFQGEYAIITGALTASNLNTWMEWMIKQQQEKYPEMTLVTVEACDDDQQKAYTITQNMLIAYPNLKGIIGNSSAAPPGASQAVYQSGKAGIVKVVGLSTPALMRESLKNGSAQVVTLWDPGRLGYLTIKLAVNMISGNKPHDGDEFASIGKIQVKGTEVIMGIPLDFTKENVDDFDF